MRTHPLQKNSNLENERRRDEHWLAYLSCENRRDNSWKGGGDSKIHCLAKMRWIRGRKGGTESIDPILGQARHHVLAYVSIVVMHHT